MLGMRDMECYGIESEIMLQVKHDGLISMDYIYENSERYYFVMPFIGGGRLDKFLEH